MFIPDEWEPAEWEDAAGKENRRYSRPKKSGRCSVPMGASGERGATLYVPDVPGELDGNDQGTATALRESEFPACVVVQSPAEAERETPAEPRARSTQDGLPSPLPPTSEADEKDAGRFRGYIGGNEGDGKSYGIGGALAAAQASGKVYAGTERV